MTRPAPRIAARRLCLECMNGSSDTVAGCDSYHCPMYPYRKGKGAGHVKLATIRKYCKHCNGWPLDEHGRLDSEYKDGGQGWARREARECGADDCPLWSFRPGASPYKGRGFVKKQPPRPTSIASERPQSTEGG